MTSFFAPLAKFIFHKNPDEYTNIHHKITSYKNDITQIFIKSSSTKLLHRVCALWDFVASGESFRLLLG